MLVGLLYKRIYIEREGLEGVATVRIENSDVTFVFDIDNYSLVLSFESLLVIFVGLVFIDEIFEVIFCIEGHHPICSAIKFDGIYLASLFDAYLDLLAREGTIDFAVEWL